MYKYYQLAKPSHLSYKGNLRCTFDVFLIVCSNWRCRKDLRVYPGQGTTEYAILVGVLVVIAILAITVFRPKLQELWDAIASGINSL